MSTPKAMLGLLGGALAAAGIFTTTGTASADPTLGNYTGTIIYGGSTYEEGSTAPWTMTGCGPDCVHLTQTGDGWDLHHQGKSWSGTDQDGTVVTLDEPTLRLSLRPPTGDIIAIKLIQNS